MNFNKIRLLWKVTLGLAVLSLATYAASCWITRNRSVPPASPLPSDEAANRQTILFLEERTKADPEDFIAQNKLAGYYLQQVREIGDLTYLKLAAHA